MHITLIRHIKTTAPSGICYGQTDVTLPEDYITTHQQIAQQLRNQQFDAIYSSPLQRCALLAKEIAGNQPITFDERLKELNFGDWEMMSWTEIEKTAEAKSFFEDHINIAPPNGESFNMMIERITYFIDHLKIKPFKNVLIVSHGGPIRIFHGLNENIDPQNFFRREVAFGEISTIQI